MLSSPPVADAYPDGKRPSGAGTPRTTWLQHQRRELIDRLRELSKLTHIRVAQPFFRIDTPIEGLEVRWTSDAGFRQDPAYECDIYFNQGYRPDFPRLHYVRNTGRALVHAIWLWDNHHLHADSMHSSMLSDVTFCAHGYASGYLKNELSLDGGFIPLCPIFWEMREVEAASEAALLGPRSDKLYGGYNSYYEFPQRDVLLAQVKEAVPNNHIFITPHGTSPEDHPFYGMSPYDRLVELMGYKVSLCAAFGKNTAIRIFDTLLAGGIPLLLGRPADLPNIFSAEDMERLPVVVLDEFDPVALERAHRQCLERFDQEGPEGAMRRSNFIREHHMPANRLALMVSRIRELAAKADELEEALERE